MHMRDVSEEVRLLVEQITWGRGKAARKEVVTGLVLCHAPVSERIRQDANVINTCVHIAVCEPKPIKPQLWSLRSLHPKPNPNVINVSSEHTLAQTCVLKVLWRDKFCHVGLREIYLRPCGGERSG